MFVWGADAVRPGDSSLDASQIQPRADTLLVSIVDGETVQPVGAVELATGRTDDGRIWRSERMGIFGEEVAVVDSFAIDARTLAPVYRGAGTQLRRDVGDAFHANSIDLILSALPLAEGYAAELALESDALDASSKAHVRVLGQTSVRTLRGARCTAWEVEVNTGDTLGRYWIDALDGTLVQFAAPTEGMRLTRGRGC